MTATKISQTNTRLASERVRFTGGTEEGVSEKVERKVVIVFNVQDVETITFRDRTIRPSTVKVTYERTNSDPWEVDTWSTHVRGNRVLKSGREGTEIKFEMWALGNVSGWPTWLRILIDDNSPKD